MPVRDIRQGERKRKKKAAFGQGTGLREIAGAPNCRAPSRPSWGTRLALRYGRTHVGADKRLEKTLRPDPGRSVCLAQILRPVVVGSIDAETHRRPDVLRSTCHARGARTH
jgi:hypothetical protein